MKHLHLLPLLVAVGACTAPETTGDIPVLVATELDSVSVAAIPEADYRIYAYADGRYLFLDPKRTLITEYHPATGAVHSRESSGRGPGELAQPKDMMVIGGTTHVFDDQPPSMLRFGPGLAFQGRTEYPQNTFIMKPLGGDRWVHHEFDPAMLILGRMEGTAAVAEHQEPVSHISKTGILLASDPVSGRAVAAALFGPEIWLRSAEGVWVKGMNPDVPTDNPMVSVGPVSMPTYKMHHAAFFVGGSACLISGATRLDRSEPGAARRILCFREDGSVAGRIEIPRLMGIPHAVNDTLHLFNPETLHIRRLHVE